jgi:hypothetical protein
MVSMVVIFVNYAGPPILVQNRLSEDAVIGFFFNLAPLAIFTGNMRITGGLLITRTCPWNQRWIAVNIKVPDVDEVSAGIVARNPACVAIAVHNRLGVQPKVPLSYYLAKSIVIGDISCHTVA